MNSPGIRWISAHDPPQAFPDIDLALYEPNGLLAAGGDLSEARLLYAYQHGIFPWYEQGQPILWWSPEPRCVLRPRDFHLSRRSARALRNSGFRVTFDRRFVDVLRACAAPRDGQTGTWITAEMRAAYRKLHAAGWAHSVEILRDGELAGGLYGVGIGRVFFGESMFSRESNASKAALLVLCRLLAGNDCPLMDCQVESAHLMSLGAIRMPRSVFKTLLGTACRTMQPMAFWPQQEIELSSML